MLKRWCRRARSLFTATLCATAVANAEHVSAQDIVRADQLIERALNDNLAYTIVESLSTEIGPRLAGTASEAKARNWAVKLLKSLHFQNVRIEPFKVRVWTRVHESAHIVDPFPQPLAATALGNSVATPTEGLEGEILRFESLDELVRAPMHGFEDKIVFLDQRMTRTQDGSGYREAVPRRSQVAYEAGRRGALAVLIRSLGTDSHRFAHTGGMRYAKDVRQIPAAALSAPDAEQLTRAVRLGPVRVNLKLDVKGGGRTGFVWEGSSDEMAESGNVIAEIPGRTNAIVLVGAHLDSWDLGTGAIDDAAGVGIVIAAAKLVADLPGKPKRTIRVVLFGAEEVGLAGARAYTLSQRSHLASHVIAAESDFGARRIWRLQTRWGEDQLGKITPFLRALGRLGVIQGDNQAYGGPDLQFLWPAGVPIVMLTQDGRDYYDVHHTADDTLDKIEPSELAQNVAVYAAFIHLATEIEGGFRTQAQ